MSRIVALAAAAVVVFPATAQATDFAATARNIIPSGQYGGYPVPAGADQQAQMYDALTPLFNQVTDADLQTKFNSQGFGAGPMGPAYRSRPRARASRSCATSTACRTSPASRVMTSPGRWAGSRR